MTDNDQELVEVDGQNYEAETVSRAMLDAIIGRAPVFAAMSDQSLREGISANLLGARHCHFDHITQRHS